VNVVKRTMARSLSPSVDHNKRPRGLFRLDVTRKAGATSSFQALFEDAPDAMLIYDSEGRIAEANAHAEELFESRWNELVGGDLKERIPGLFVNIAEPQPTGLPKSSPHNLALVRKDGSRIPIEISVSEFENSEGAWSFCILRRRSPTDSEKILKSQLEFEGALSKLSATFINLPPSQVNAKIKEGLQTFAEALGGDRSSIAVIDRESGDLFATHSWACPGAPEFPPLMVKTVLPWLAKQIKMGEPVLATTPDDFPPEAVAEKRYMESLGLKSTLVVPLRVGGTVIGLVSCSSFRMHQKWDPVQISRFQAAAEVFANALARKQANENLQSAYAEIRGLKEQLEKENIYLRQEIALEHRHHKVIGKSSAIREVLKKAEQVARTDSTVLVLGETGTGKELIARTIHEMSGRSKRALVKTNCAALPETLIESELFGREKGAYTGSLAREIGRFELADQSTIFLDEIGELPPEVQAKLLRVLQEGEFERLGSSKTIKVNVRVIAATSRDLQAMVNEGKFRADLFYRLNVFPIVVPPLRERIEDIPDLVWHILGEMAPRMGRTIEGVNAGTMSAFQRYAWPGNVRELRNVIERNLILNRDSVFRAEFPEMNQKVGRDLPNLAAVESEYFLSVLEAKGWRIRGKGGAAASLGLKPTTLESRMKKLGIVRPS
jgi:formate hydrogenlyase transcriptional activator